MKKITDQRIAPMLVAPKMLLTPAMKTAIVDAALVSAWVNRTPRLVIRMGVDGRTPGNIGHAVSIKHAPSPDLIGIFGTYPPCGLNRILHVANKRQSSSLALVRNTQKLDAVVDGKISQ